MSAETSDRREFLKDSGKWILLTGAANIRDTILFPTLRPETGA